VLVLTGCDERGEGKTGKQVIMLGFDGMDPNLCRELIDAGRMPNFAKLARTGGFEPLQTSTPPQSPVAWSSIITGTNPGVHGIFDFIHRNPKTYGPNFSTSRLGDWVFPLKSGKVINLRQGTPFWEYLTAGGIGAQVYRIPANYPPTESPGPGKFSVLTDMGTPDLTGSLGQFTYYTSGPWEGDMNPGGGQIVRLRIRPLGGNTARSQFYGPPDALLDVTKVGDRAHEPLKTEFVIFRDKDSKTALIEWDTERVLLKEGEWSDWQHVPFAMGPNLAGEPLKTVSGVMRMYLRHVDPAIELYVTPIMIDPADPVMPVSIPDDFAPEVEKALGPYFTKGLPEDTKALWNKVLSRDEFLQQADMVLQERVRLLDFALERYREGFLFFYFGSTDQIAHMFWSAMAPSHPALTAEESARYRDVIRDVYVKMDAQLGKVLERFPQATILCVSDHGFADFARGFNLNTWLIDNGFAVPTSPNRRDVSAFDWSRSKAYALGINGLYINLKGREGQGIVEPADKQSVIDAITAGLLAVRDPETGEAPIKAVYQADKVYHGDQLGHAPDLQIGYALRYRGSWSTALGGAPQELLENNTEAWCGDHCIATDLVPGVVFSNRPLKLSSPTLEDLAPTILREFGITPPPAMRGGDIFESNSRPN
jgi:predicted AlkP superfamily phosphohydrolase/phosphomutase